MPVSIYQSEMHEFFFLILDNDSGGDSVNDADNKLCNVFMSSVNLLNYLFLHKVEMIVY